MLRLPPLLALGLITLCAPAAQADSASHFSSQLAERIEVSLARLDEFAEAGEPVCASELSLVCTALVDRYCAHLGYEAGFGAPTEADAAVFHATCVGAPLVTRLAAPLPDCDAGLGHACHAALQQACSDAALEPGFGPVDLPDETGHRIVCTEAGSSPDRATTLFYGGEGCDGEGAPSELACLRAIDDWCHAQPGFAGGFPVSTAEPLEVSCIAEHDVHVPNATLPPYPALGAEVQSTEVLFDEHGEAYYPDTHTRRDRLNSHRPTSVDGRLTVRGCTRPAAEPNDPDERGYCFDLNTPEALTHRFSEPVPEGEVGRVVGQERNLETWTDPVLFFSGAGAPGRVNHVALCPRLADDSVNERHPVAGGRYPSPETQRANPRACDEHGLSDPEGAFDCYDITVVGVFELRQLHGTSTLVRVADPKTADARVVEVKPGAPVFGYLRGGGVILEPAVTGDGRLVVTHGGPNGLLQYAMNDGTPLPGSDVVPNPCDVRAWGDWRPLADMYRDPRVQRYGLARYPFRDMENRIIPGTEAGPQGTSSVVWGAYPWIDREGNNVAFAQGSAALYYEDADSGEIRARFEVLGAPGQDPLAPDPLSPPHPTELACTDPGAVPGCPIDLRRRVGTTFAGLWTRGKLVTFDNRLTAGDFGIPMDHPRHHRTLALYVDDPNGGVDVGRTAQEQITSTQGQLNHLPQMATVAPAEVVWQMTDSVASDEVVFDDYLLHRAFIVSAMQPSIDNTTRVLHDGFAWQLDPEAEPPLAILDNRGRGFLHPPHVANAATPVPPEMLDLVPTLSADELQWRVPAYGLLLGGARVEPVPAGGIAGRGVFLDGVDDRIEYRVETPTVHEAEFREGDWLTTLALDPRAVAAEAPLAPGPRRLLTWPDGSWLDWVVGDDDAQGLRYGVGIDTLGEVAIPAALALAPKQWSHVAVHAAEGGAAVFSLDGFPLARREPAQRLFRMDALPAADVSAPRERIGRLTLGFVADTGPAFRGWVDELKAIAYAPRAEEVCNHARGTLVAVRAGSADPQEQHLHARAAAFAAAGSPHGLAPLLAEGELAVCERVTDRVAEASPLCVGRTRAPQLYPDTAERCLRDAALEIPPLRADLPRPDTTANPFCNHCHDDAHASPTLQSTAALSAGEVAMECDPRRQPFQTAPLVSGVVPAALFHAPDGRTFPYVAFGTGAWGHPQDVFTTRLSAPELDYTEHASCWIEGVEGGGGGNGGGEPRGGPLLPQPGEVDAPSFDPSGVPDYATIPEPGPGLLGGLAVGVVAWWRRRVGVGIDTRLVLRALEQGAHEAG